MGPQGEEPRGGLTVAAGFWTYCHALISRCMVLLIWPYDASPVGVNECIELEEAAVSASSPTALASEQVVVIA